MEPKYFYKYVSLAELNCHITASENNLAPKILEHRNLPGRNDRFEIKMFRYPETLFNVMEDKTRKDEALFIVDQMDILVKKLHSVGILHGDISEENIVYDKESKCVLLIDFGMSRLISSILPEELTGLISEYYENTDVDPKMETIDALLRAELGTVSFLKRSIDRNN